LAAQVLLKEGFQEVDPSHPLGGKDSGKDAVCTKAGKRWVMGVYFPRGQQTFTDIEKKFLADLEGAQKNKAEGFAFVTNQELRLAERQILNSAWQERVELYHLERLTAILDAPEMAQVRKQFLGIESNETIREPVVHLEPEHELIWSTGPNQKVGEFHVKLSNTGTEDIDHIVLIEDYFVALKLPNVGIIIKNVGGVPVESGVCTSLGAKKDCQIFINFAPTIAVMNEVAQNNAVPNRLGVRLTITFRRKIDGAPYRIVKGYGIIGPHAEGLFPPGVPQDIVPLELRSQFLSMSEVVPYLDVSEYWTSVVHNIGQDSQGIITNRYH
jgi:hypothetical protein